MVFTAWLTYDNLGQGRLSLAIHVGVCKTRKRNAIDFAGLSFGH